MEKYTLEQAIEKMTEIASNPSPLTGSLFTAENVLSILNSIEPPKAKSSLPENWEIDLKDEMVSFIQDDFNDFVDYDDAEFELNGDRLSLESVGYMSHRIKNAVDYFINNTVSDMLEPVEEEEVPAPSDEERYLCETCDKPQTKEEHEFSDICGECRESIDC